MDINNNQQIHTFGKGMNTDTSDMYISNELYRYAENLRYTTNEGSNSGELRLLEGTKAIALPGDQIWDEIIEMTSIRDYLIVIGSKIIGGKEYFNIWRKNLGEPRKDGLDGWRYLLRDISGNPTWLPLESRNLSLCGRWESDKNVKLYIADGVHPLMCLRMNNFYEVTHIDNIDDLSVQINYLLPPPRVSVFESRGSLKPAKVLYAYTLSDDSGMETSLSILSNTVSLYNDNKGYGINESIVTDSAAKILIEYRDETKHLDNIRLYRITYRQGGQPPLIELFYDDKRVYLSEHEGLYIDTGSITIKTLSVEEFLAITKLGIIPQEVESKDQYLFLGNIKYTQDQVDELVKDIDCKAEPVGIDNCYNNGCLWNPSDWFISGTDKFGGLGEYFKWEFEFDDHILNLDNSTLGEENSNNIDRKSLRRGEIYRYGVILYDKHGRASSPKYISDVMVPPAWYSDATNGSFEVILNIDRTTILDSCCYTVRCIGIKFTQVKDFPSDKGIIGWLILRVRRTIADKINITQGIMGSPHLVIGSDETKRYLIDTMNDYSSALLSMLMEWENLIRAWHEGENYKLDNDYGYCIKDQDISIFMSPEVCYHRKEFENILPEAELIKCVNVKTYNIDILKRGAEFFPNGYTVKDTILNLRYKNGGLPSAGRLYSQLIAKYKLRYMERFMVELKTNLNNVPEFCVRNITGFLWVKFSLNHLYPISENTVNPDTLKDNVLLSNVSFITAPEYNTFSTAVYEDEPDKDRNFTYKDHACFAGTKSFTDWIMWMYHFYDHPTLLSSMTSEQSDFRYATATGPTCALLQSKEDLGFGYYVPESTSSLLVFPLQVVNITRRSAVPYGGHDYALIHSQFVERDNVESPLTSDKQLTVFDGDCFIGMFTANMAHIWLDPICWCANRCSTIYTIPIESDINLKATCGDLYPRMLQDEKFCQQDLACMIKFPLVTYVLSKDSYQYNTAYSNEEDIISKYIIKYKSTDSNNHDGRIHYSLPKVNGQDPDPWPDFKPTNYIDVDTRYGAITGLKLFKDKLLFWQENATGALTVNEKVITQASNGSDIILGTSDVMQRYDYLSTVYGMYKYQHAFTESNNALYWWDSYNKELLLYGGGSLIPLTKTHGLENYINTSKESDRPHLAYDCDYEEIISNVRNNEALTFNERTNAFTSVYTFTPVFSAIIDGKLYLANRKQIYKMDSQLVNGESYLFNKKAYPLLKYIVNPNTQFVKTFDILTMGANFYNGNYHYVEPICGNDNSKLKPLRFKYKTKLNQESEIGGLSVSNREYDYRLDIPRNGAKVHDTKRIPTKDWGDRMRGKTMQCELSSISNSTDFSLQYIITKYRMSWS